ncbi:hypothetical protein [Lonsdalea populi]|nr:hypothetical protein [Lonsdalea populi]QPQ23764.1 hypothetical protein I6N93_14370 [Lonsdalea populi]
MVAQGSNTKKSAAILLPMVDYENKKATTKEWLNFMIFITKFGGPCWT